VNFMWLSGMQCPDFNTINLFRKNRLADAVDDIFTQVVCILTILTPILMILTPSKRAGLSKSSLCLLANRQQRSCKDITFSFS